MLVGNSMKNNFTAERACVYHYSVEQKLDVRSLAYLADR